MVSRVVLVKLVELIELVRLVVLVKLLLFDCCVLSDVAGGLWLGGPDVGAATAAAEGRRPSQAARGRCCCCPRGQRWGHRTQHAATETQEQHFVRKAANSHSPHAHAHTHTPHLISPCWSPPGTTTTHLFCVICLQEECSDQSGSDPGE